MPRSKSPKGRGHSPEDPKERAADPAAEAVASVRAHLQTALSSIEGAVNGLGFTSGAHSSRERWRRLGGLLQQALDEIQAAKTVCDRGAPLTLEPER